MIRELPCKVMISGYASDLYDNMLDGWLKITFRANTHQGIAIETLWMNYPEPALLHDYSYLGADFREREHIKRKVRRWSDNLAKLPTVERQTILSALIELASSDQDLSESDIVGRGVVGRQETPATIAALQLGRLHREEDRC